MNLAVIGFLFHPYIAEYSGYKSTPGGGITDEDSGDENFTTQNRVSSTRAPNLYRPLHGSEPNGGSVEWGGPPENLENSSARINYTGTSRPVPSQYSIIMRQDLDISPALSLEDIPEVSEEEEEEEEEEWTIPAGYSIIRREDMGGYVSESVSEEEERCWSKEVQDIAGISTRRGGERSSVTRPRSGGEVRREQDTWENNTSTGAGCEREKEVHPGRRNEDMVPSERLQTQRPRMPTPPTQDNTM
jgi:hypothetical protein